MEMGDASGPRRQTGRLIATYLLVGLALVSLVVFLASVFAAAFGVWDAIVSMLVSGALIILALAVGIFVSPFTRWQRPAPRPTARPMLFRDTHVSAARFALGVVDPTGQHYLAIPVSNGVVDYDEHYLLGPEEYAALSRDEAAGARFAEQCRRRELDDRLLHRPAEHRGMPI